MSGVPTIIRLTPWEVQNVLSQGVSRGVSGRSVGEARTAESVLLEEHFEDTEYSTRGWYDDVDPVNSNTEQYRGLECIQFEFAQSATNPYGRIGRHLFTARPNIYLDYWVKYSANWEGSDDDEHPHEFIFMTDDMGDYQNPATSTIALIVETHHDGATGMVIRVGIDPSSHPEHAFYDSAVVFTDAPGPGYKGDYHRVRVRVEMNSAVGVADGIIQAWFDEGDLVIDENTIEFRAREGEDDLLWDQLMLTPYIGVGSPVDQTVWYDDLVLSTVLSTPVIIQTLGASLVHPRLTGVATAELEQGPSTVQTLGASLVHPRLVGAAYVFGVPATIQTLGRALVHPRLVGVSTDGADPYVDAFWRTTFDCTEQEQVLRGVGGSGFDCDYLSNGSDKPANYNNISPPEDYSPDYTSRITSAANHSAGSGGRGFRMVIGDGANNDNSGNIILTFANVPDADTYYKEIWMRAYVRYESGFEWPGGIPYYHKFFYFHPSTGYTIPGWQSTGPRGQAGIYSSVAGYLYSPSLGWSDAYPGGTSDGSWFCFESYLKMDTVIGGVSQNDGIGATWLNGIAAGRSESVNYSGGSATVAQGWKDLQFFTNQSAPDNGGVFMNLDYDDIVMYTSTPAAVDAGGKPMIGPIGW